MTSFSLRSVIGGTLTHCGVEGGARTHGGGASHCKHSSLTNKVLLWIINSSEGGRETSVAGVRCACVAGVGVGASPSIYQPGRRVDQKGFNVRAPGGSCVCTGQ